MANSDSSNFDNSVDKAVREYMEKFDLSYDEALVKLIKDKDAQERAISDRLMETTNHFSKDQVDQINEYKWGYLFRLAFLYFIMFGFVFVHNYVFDIPTYVEVMDNYVKLLPFLTVVGVTVSCLLYTYLMHKHYKVYLTLSQMCDFEGDFYKHHISKHESMRSTIFKTIYANAARTSKNLKSLRSFYPSFDLLRKLDVRTDMFIEDLNKVFDNCGEESETTLYL